MSSLLTFVIPVRHYKNAHDWDGVKRRLSETILSIAQQQEGCSWKAVIVANSGADLPELPPRFEVAYVDFPPNDLYMRWSDHSDEEIHEAVRRDKGRRVLAGMLHARDSKYFMVVDDDDLVSRGLVSFVSQHTGENGWYFDEGYIWTDGGRLLCRARNFWLICGSSHIVRSDLYHLPATIDGADDVYVQRILGAHIFLRGHFDQAGTALLRLPFAGAVYRSGHAESHSRSRGILRGYLLRKRSLKSPAELCRRVLGVRIRSKRLEREFFGASVARQSMDFWESAIR